MKTVLVVGTATEVGKTWTTASLLRLATTAGVRAAARKPVQSFDPADADPTDAEVLAAASDDDPEMVCLPHRWLPTPMAPPMATAALDLAPITLAELVREVHWGTELLDIGFVESVGGVRSPVAEDGDSIDLARAIAPDLVVLVADAALGVIDRVRLATDALTNQTVVVLLNQFDESDDLHVRNRDWLRERDGIDIVTNVAALFARIAPA